MPESSPPRLAAVAPVFHVSDLAASMAYYRDCLKFESRFEWSDSDNGTVRYAIVCRDDVELHLAQTDEAKAATAYCFVDGIDTYYALACEGAANITHPIVDQPWQMREFGIADPDGNVLYFGEHLERIAQGAGNREKA